jgi:hypothetical protein
MLLTSFASKPYLFFMYKWENIYIYYIKINLLFRILFSLNIAINKILTKLKITSKIVIIYWSEVKIDR